MTVGRMAGGGPLVPFEPLAKDHPYDGARTDLDGR